jgi:crotonobetainyl-CoA:carnitine CoA-transferase CaiB-like acyl-CoA transferase
MAPVSNVEDLTRFNHLKERGYWLTAPLPNGREAQVPGIFANLTTTPLNVRRWPPQLGEHTEEVLAEKLALSSSQIAAASGRAPT